MNHYVDSIFLPVFLNPSLVPSPVGNFIEEVIPPWSKIPTIRNSRTMVKHQIWNFDYFATEYHYYLYMFIDFSRTTVKRFEYGTLNHNVTECHY